jgi:hypothetical protein
MTSASTPIGSGCAKIWAASARLPGCSMNSAAREAARTSEVTTSGFSSDQLCLTANTFSAAPAILNMNRC